MKTDFLLRLSLLTILALAGIFLWTAAEAVAGSPLLNVAVTVSDEPLLGGDVGYHITVQNNGVTPVTDRAYNLTITNTLPISVSFQNANPSPTHVAVQPNGETLLVWDNLADLEATESLEIKLTARLASGLTTANEFLNRVNAAVNSVPDNSGAWNSAAAQVIARPQAIDIEARAIQSTGDEQAGGAGEYPTTAPGRGAGADWPYQYELTVRNNRVGGSANVQATAILPPGVAYLGNVTISPNPNSASATPSISLKTDGSLELSWSLGSLTTTQHDLPVKIRFDAAIPYKFRVKQNTAAKNGPFAGPMGGSIIPEDTLLPLNYEASATYGNVPTSDGSQSTPTDDQPVNVTAEYLTISKSASPKVVGIGTAVTFNLNYYVSEYYTTTNVILTDVLPDGMTYVNGSASATPESISPNTPGPGQTTLVWHIPAASTRPGRSGGVTFQATVDPTYEAAPYAGQPIVSGDSLTNRLGQTSLWQDDVAPPRSGSSIPDESKATVTTRMPTFSKQVWSEVSQSWVSFAQGYTGDRPRFRLLFDAAADVDAKGIVIRDFLPRGMTYVANSAQHNTSGSFSNGAGCNSAPTAPTTGWLNGLQYVEWRLCNATKGAHWEATITALVGDAPNVQPGWLVANFGKLSGHNTAGKDYSLRDTADYDYIAPELKLTKSGSPANNLLAGDTVVYTINVTNQGEAPAYNLRLVDTLPANLLVPASGGSASPAASSYTTSSGSPATGAGGVIAWGNVAQLNPGQSQTFVYTATIPNGLPAGYPLPNKASVGYNSRSDNAGHQVNPSSNSADLHTADTTVYLRGVTLQKTASTAFATIGDVVRYTLTGQVPAGFKAYWPVIEDNTLPNGFDYVAGSTVVNGAALDTAHHATQPDDNGSNKLNWYLQTLDNSAGSSPLQFSIQFDALVTGVSSANTATQYYLNYRYLETARNTAYARWYETSAGAGSGYGVAYTGGRRSGAARVDVSIRQPAPSIVKSSSPANVEAGDLVTHTLTIVGEGNDIAHELVVEDVLPAGTTFVNTVSQDVTYTFPFPPTPVLTDTNSAGDTSLRFELDRLFVGSTWQIIYTTRVTDTIAAGRVLTNTATVASYSSQPGQPADSNGDGLPDERTYTGPSASGVQFTPAVSVLKAQSNPGELTFGSSLVYTLTVPATPINATIYSAVLTDAVDSRLQVTGAVNAVTNGNSVVAALGDIPPFGQRTVVISATVPANSSGLNGDVIANSATLGHRHGQVESNSVAQPLLVPALTMHKHTAQNFIAAGDVITYTLTVANVGGGLAQNLQLTDPLPGNFSYVAGSSRVNGQPLADPVGGTWSLPALAGGQHHDVTFRATVDSVTMGESYLNTAAVTGQDSRGQAIPADNSARVPADTDADDQDTARVFSQLNWITDTTFVAYEDLKNTGWSDWDYNDLVVKLTIERGMTGGDNLAMLRINYEALARGAAYDHDFFHQLPLYGGGQADLTVRNAAGQVVRQDNIAFEQDEPTLSIFDHTQDALPSLPGFFNTNTSTSQPEQVFGYTAELTVILDDPAANPGFLLPPVPWDPYIYVYDTGQEVHLIVPGHLDNMQAVDSAYGPNASSPLLGFDLPLAQNFYEGWKWPLEFAGLWKGYPAYVDYIGSGGTLNTGWYLPASADDTWLWSANKLTPLLAAAENLAPTQRYFASPVVADLDGDNASEIVIGALLNNQLQVVDAFGGTLAGWPQTLGGAIKAAAAVADLDGNGDLEIIVGASDGKLYAFHHTGQAVAGWPVTLDSNFRVLATPAVAHLDGDSSLDIVVPLSNGKLYALNADGSLKGGWPVSIGGVEDKFASQEANSSPRIADVDGDGSPDIVVGSTDKKLYVLSANGGLKWSFPTGDMILGAPAVADIDTGRAGLEIAFGSGDSYVYLLDKSGAQIWKKRTGWTIRSSAAAADIDGNGDLEVLVSGDDDRLWAWHHSGGAVSGWPKQATADLYSSPVVGDVDGNGDLEVLVGSDDARVYGWSGAGDPVTGWPQSTGVSVKGTPALANLDDDPALEVVVGDFGGTLYIWGFSGTLPNGGSGSELTPGISRTLRFTDTARVIDVTVPGDAITEAVRLQYRPALTRTAPASSTLAGLHFHLEAFRGSSRLDGFQFQRAISLTLTYTDADVAGLDEANLQLYFWNETSQSWQNAACGAIVRRPDINQLVVPVCHLTEFGLFEVQPQSGGFTVFLPVVMR